MTFMHLLVVGTNHKVAPVEVREKVAFAEERLPDAYEHFRRRSDGEVVLLSTCNRSEIYLATAMPLSERQVVRWWAEFFGMDADELEGRFYAYRDREVARHLFRVACGLDSMMLGETQILGQVKEALEVAEQLAAVGTYLGELFRRAIKIGKRARTETGDQQRGDVRRRRRCGISPPHLCRFAHLHRLVGRGGENGR
jgi:glutamyl-tRNA reductase